MEGPAKAPGSEQKRREGKGTDEVSREVPCLECLAEANVK